MRANTDGWRTELVLRMKFGMRESSGLEWIASVTPRGPTKSYGYCQAVSRKGRPTKDNITFYGQPNFVASWKRRNSTGA